MPDASSCSFFEFREGDLVALWRIAFSLAPADYRHSPPLGYVDYEKPAIPSLLHPIRHINHKVRIINC